MKEKGRVKSTQEQVEAWRAADAAEERRLKNPAARAASKRKGGLDILTPEDLGGGRGLKRGEETRMGEVRKSLILMRGRDYRLQEMVMAEGQRFEAEAFHDVSNQQDRLGRRGKVVRIKERITKRNGAGDIRNEKCI